MNGDTQSPITTYNNDIKPFIRWAGGKRHLLPELVKRLPKTPIKRYHEPFLGGGALFLALSDQIEEAVLSDINYDLVLTWRMVQECPDKVLLALKTHEQHHSSEYFYQVRNHNCLHDPIERAARFIYLNKTCFNGVYRVNKKGAFNVPLGRSKAKIADHINLKKCSEALKNAQLTCQDFWVTDAREGDFVYFDPPYHHTDNKGFTGYTAEGFTEKDHKLLRDVAVDLHHKGIAVMISNADTPFVRSLYREPFFNIDGLVVNHSINRSQAKEVIIKNYK